MSLAINMVLLTICSIFIAIILNKPAEEILPLSIFSVALILLPFYCLNLLIYGRVFIYILMLFIVTGSFLYLKNKKLNFLKEFVKKISPGICLYAVLCLFFVLYLKENLVSLCDELRLWGAVPKALFATESLQLGNDAWIFNLMQSYPPGMPLLVYFFTSFSTTFAEYHIFVVYAIVFSSVFVYALKDLRWKQWFLFVPLFLTVVIIPCLFTSHGGDASYFYESLFIDSVLGVIAGFVFYLSSRRPLDSLYGTIRFLISASFLVGLKDSAITFAIAALLCAIIVYVIKNRNNFNKAFFVRVGVILLAMLFVLLVWKTTISIYHVSNHISTDKPPISFENILILIKEMIITPLMIINIKGNIISLSFFACLVMIIALYSFMNFKYRHTDKITTLVEFIIMIISLIIFAAGYTYIFNGALLSYQRYFTTVIYYFATFALIYAMIRVIKYDYSRIFNNHKILKSCVAVVLSIVFCIVSYAELSEWKIKKIDQTFIPVAEQESGKLLLATKDEKNTKKVYILISGNPYRNAYLHHRIYYNLIGSNLIVGNFYNDSNIVGGSEPAEDLSTEEIIKARENWLNRLKNQEFDYVHVVSVDHLTETILHDIIDEPLQASSTYRVNINENDIKLNIVN